MVDDVGVMEVKNYALLLFTHHWLPGLPSLSHLKGLLASKFPLPTHIPQRLHRAGVQQFGLEFGAWMMTDCHRFAILKDKHPFLSGNMVR